MKRRTTFSGNRAVERTLNGIDLAWSSGRGYFKAVRKNDSVLQFGDYSDAAKAYFLCAQVVDGKPQLVFATFTTSPPSGLLYNTHFTILGS